MTETTTLLIDKFEALSEALNGELFELDREIHGASVALLAGQHVFFLGPPGVAKSKLVDRLMAYISDVRYYKILLKRLTMPDEIFGPIDVAKMKESRWTRLSQSYLPDAQAAFIDEALALGTPIFTPSGWRTIGDLAVGDEVLGTAGMPTKVRDLTPIATDHDCFRVTFRDGESIVADGGHLWSCRPQTGGTKSPWRVLSTAEMSKTGRKYQIPLPEPIELPEQDLPLDPYILGLWLGNGNNWTGQLYVRNEYLEGTLSAIQAIFPDARPTLPSPGMMTVSLAGTHFRTGLRELGLIQNKHVPAHYVNGSIKQRLAFLQGLMDTDGYMNSAGTCVFSNTIESLADAVVTIARSLGLVASKKLTKDTRVGKLGPHQPCWKVTFRADPDLPPFRGRKYDIPRQVWGRRHLIHSVTPVPSVPVRCITVDAPDHLFLAGTNLAVTHNCFKASSAILNGLLDILNEREWRDDGQVKPVPLSSMFCASNEEPQEEGLVALYDRIMLRYEVKPIQDTSSFISMLKAGPFETPEPILSWADIEAAQAQARALPFNDSVYDKMAELKDLLREKGIEPTPRRHKNSLGILQAEAWLDGATEVAPSHMSILAHSHWESPSQAADVERIVLDLANPLERQANKLLADLEDIVSLVDSARKAPLTEEDAHHRGMEIFGRVKEAALELNGIEGESGGGRRLAQVMGQSKTRLNFICRSMVTDVFGLPESEVEAMMRKASLTPPKAKK